MHILLPGSKKLRRTTTNCKLQILFMDTLIAPFKPATGNTDFLPLQGTDYVQFYVGNAKQAAHFYKTAFGFQSLAYAGPETGVRDRASYAVRQSKLTFVFTTALRNDSDIEAHV